MGLTDYVFCIRQVHLQPLIFHSNVTQLGCILFNINTTDTPDEVSLYAETCSGYNYIVCAKKKLQLKITHIYHVQIYTNDQKNMITILLRIH
jgi:hypothetical protein